MKKQQKRSRISRSASALAAVVLLLTSLAASGQNVAEPRREQLLNGLKLLIVNRQGDPNVLLKLRVHSGAAFDLAGKEGLTSLLTDAFFDAETRAYVKDELGGRLDVSTNYDAINITLEGKTADFERLAELLRGALLNTQLTPESVTRLREARIKTAREVSLAP
ncbi:MAG: insulinase family protein, partial [Pyrinomonadaceae bacterium]